MAPAPLHRRTLLRAASALSAACLLPHSPSLAADPPPIAPATDQQIRDYLRPLLLTRDDVALWLKEQAFPFARYDSELGYLHRDREFPEGLDGALCRYRYDKLQARRMLAYADEPCRINTYGDSYTSCEQVSDGETWQEALAAHLGEPLRNYGIGAYSVYQAWRRLQREEQRAPARVIIFNIFHDDHIRNLHGWQRFKFGVNRKSPSPTVPHLLVARDNAITERPNPCPTAESVYDLCDLDRAHALFAADYYLQNRLDRLARQAQGQPPPPTDYDDERLLQPGLVATLWVLDRLRQFARQHEKRVLYVLSYSARSIAQSIRDQRRLDQPLVDYLQTHELPYVDLLSAHVADAAQFKSAPADALARYYVGRAGHYNPLGNHFCAFAIKPSLLRLLDPPPPAYRP